MSDRSYPPGYGDYSRLSRLPEIRLLGARHALHDVAPAGDLPIDRPGRTCFYFLKTGFWQLCVADRQSPPDRLGPGTAVVLEDGASHRWHACATNAGPSTLLAGHVDRRHTMIHRMMRTVMVMPTDAGPCAAIIAHAAAAIESDLTGGAPDEGTQRRLAEVVQLQVLRFMQARLERVGAIPPAVRRDAALVRAWTAFLRDPDRPWTLASLAAVAGVSRAVFAARFATSVGRTPMASMRAVRIGYAADMLRASQAPIAEIAQKVGYGSDVALMRAFRRERGVTPAHWRRGEDPLVPAAAAPRRSTG